MMALEADRALELIGRAIRMAGYRHAQPAQESSSNQDSTKAIELHQTATQNGSDSIVVRHELSSGADFDCIGNVLTKERTKQGLVHQGFFVNKQSLICQSLDKQGRLQNTTLLSGVHALRIRELSDSGSQAQSWQRAYRVRLEMASEISGVDESKTSRGFERIFSTRNLR